MSKVILQFTMGHGRYEKGDVAGFDSDTALKLRGVTMPYSAKAKAAVVEVNALEDRERDLAARELDFETRVAAAGLSAQAKEPAAGDPPVQGGKAAAGDPPAQGGKAAAGDPPVEGSKVAAGDPPAQGKVKG
jgi:hypothetical protein